MCKWPLLFVFIEAKLHLNWNTMKWQQLSEIWQRESKDEGAVRPLADPTTPASDRCPDAAERPLRDPLSAL